MLIPADVLAQIRTGTVTLAFRRWTRPRVRPGTALRTMIGLVEVTAVGEVGPDDITEADASRAGFPSRDALLAYLDSRPDGALYRVAVRYGGPDPRIALRERGDLDETEGAEVLERLARFDRRGPWTAQVLQLLADNEGVRAADLAASIGWETAPFKRDVRKLKELGLTESLGTGYRVSPRGRAILDALR
ncbi:hypothetical protein [Spirillospora sp. CA-294931]|uniref:hypothetical protein n=1 Tax=Spirillospora sp. CA-294931 TaxID=3240042 RepID=UPI003D8CB057